MILARVSRFRIAIVVTAGALVAPGVAHADVLEVNPEGARWVAGGKNAPPLATEILDESDAQVSPGNVSSDRPQRITTEVLAEYATRDAVQPSIENSVDVPEVALADVAKSAEGIPAKYAAKVQELSRRFDLSASLLEALVWQESRWRENAVSHAGARGLAQLMPATARYLGVDPDDPMQNLEGGARYLREQMDRFDGDLEKALAAYNAGPGRVIRAGGIPNIRETKQYVAAIMGRLADHSRPASTQQ